MKRDFSMEACEEIVGYLEEVEPDDFAGRAEDAICDGWYYIKHLFTKPIGDTTAEKMKRYRKEVADKRDLKIAQVRDVFIAANEVDGAYAAKGALLYENATQLLGKLKTVTAMAALEKLSGVTTLGRIDISFSSIVESEGPNLIYSPGEYTIKSEVYDETGSYGGDQGGPSNETDPEKRQQYYDLICENSPNKEWTIEMLDEYLASVEKMGCAYTAYANIIMQYFEGRPEKFEATFGYGMYTENGDLNYNMLIVDICSFFEKKNVNGVNALEMEYELDSFLAEHGISVNTSANCGEYIKDSVLDIIYNIKGVIGMEGGGHHNHRAGTPEDYRELIESGKYVVVTLGKGSNLINVDGSVEAVSERHTMVVTGITDDGKFIVSSWGKKCYLDPDEGEQFFWTIDFE